MGEKGFVAKTRVDARDLDMLYEMLSRKLNCLRNMKVNGQPVVYNQGAIKG